MADSTARLAQLASSVGDDLMVIESERRQDQGTAAHARNRRRPALAWHDRAGGLQQHGWRSSRPSYAAAPAPLTTGFYPVQR
jgi:hypothetical protein